ncbi:uncharacterized protein ACB058_011730 [Synchiropus picturatus]
MLAVLLLLCSAVVLGSSQDYQELLYGEGFRIELQIRARSLTIRTDPYGVKVLWAAEKPRDTVDPRHSVEANYFVMNQMTQWDNGRYDLLDKYNNRLFSVNIRVVAHEKTYNLDPGESVNFQYDLPFTSCNVFFTPEDYRVDDAELVRRGRVQYRRNCRAISISRPCKFNIESVDTSCSGTYEIKDDKENTALQVTLTVKESSGPDIPAYGWVGISAAISSTLCYCLKCCCCSKSGSKKDSSEAAEDAAVDADPTQMQYESEPIRLGPRETVEELPYPAEPPPPPSAPLIHNSSVSQPPSYEEALALTEETGGSPHLLTSSAEPRFEFTGMKFSSTPPLSSEVTSSDVYTSDKLNFL